MATRNERLQKALKDQTVPPPSFRWQQVMRLIDLRNSKARIEQEIHEVEHSIILQSTKFAVTRFNTTYVVECTGTPACPIVKIEEVKNEGVV